MASAAVVKGLYEKRGWYYYQPPTPKQGGGTRPPAVALKTRDLVEAINQIEAKAMEATLERPAAGTVAEALPIYYAARAGDAKPTRRARKVVLDGFKKAIGNRRMEQIDRAVIDEWRATLRQKGPRGWPVSLATLRSYAITLRAFLNWARKEGYIRNHPMDGMGREVRVAITRVQGFCTEEEREKLLAAEAPEYLKLILMLGFFAGLRDGEMLALNPKWIWLADDGSRGSITVQNTPIEFMDGTPGVWQPKGRRRRTIPLHPRLLEFLKDYGMRSPWLRSKSDILGLND